MLEVNQNKIYGVKLTVISEMDSIDLEKITSEIRRLGYNITYCDNGNVVCEKRKK